MSLPECSKCHKSLIHGKTIWIPKQILAHWTSWYPEDFMGFVEKYCSECWQIVKEEREGKYE